MGKSTFKQAITERMAATGENYTQAKRAVLIERAPIPQVTNPQWKRKLQLIAHWQSKMALDLPEVSPGWSTSDTAQAADVLSTVSSWSSAPNHTFLPGGGGLDLSDAEVSEGGISLYFSDEIAFWFKLQRLLAVPAFVPGISMLLIECGKDPYQKKPMSPRGWQVAKAPGSPPTPVISFMPTPNTSAQYQRRFTGGSFLLASKGALYNGPLDGLATFRRSSGTTSYDAYSAPQTTLGTTAFLQDCAEVRAMLERSDRMKEFVRDVDAYSYYIRNNLPIP